MQYFKPPGDFFSVTVCLLPTPVSSPPLLSVDEGRHKGLGGSAVISGRSRLTTTDLVHWTHHPQPPIDTARARSICTGSTVYHDGIYHAFLCHLYARLDTAPGHAVSRDVIHFTKTTPNPFASPCSGYSPKDYRDPFVFPGTMAAFMLVTANGKLCAPRSAAVCSIRLGRSRAGRGAVADSGGGYRWRRCARMP
ncbi:MAG: hypothetical protein R3E79_33670 [Caldilineaceae bacterium]